MAEHEELIFAEEVHRIIGCAMEVHNHLGFGLNEKCYENSLAIEFRQHGIPFDQQTHFPVYYKDHIVGKFIPDLICFQKIIVDTKTIGPFTDREIAQMINYLRVTGLTLGLLINFNQPKLKWKRVILTRASDQDQLGTSQ